MRRRHRHRAKSIQPCQCASLSLDSERIREETVACAEELRSQYPDMGAIVLECSILPPYAKAVQEATGLPVFDFVTMINYFYEGTHRQAYQGYY